MHRDRASDKGGGKAVAAGRQGRGSEMQPRAKARWPAGFRHGELARLPVPWLWRLGGGRSHDGCYGGDSVRENRGIGGSLTVERDEVLGEAGGGRVVAMFCRQRSAAGVE